MNLLRNDTCCPQEKLSARLEELSWLPGISLSLLKMMMKSEFRERSHIILFTLVSQ